MALDRAEQLLGGAQPVYLVLDREHLSHLELLSAQTARRTRVLTTIDIDGELDRDDWVVVTNVEG